MRLIWCTIHLVDYLRMRQKIDPIWPSFWGLGSIRRIAFSNVTAINIRDFIYIFKFPRAVTSLLDKRVNSSNICSKRMEDREAPRTWIRSLLVSFTIFLFFVSWRLGQWTCIHVFTRIHAYNDVYVYIDLNYFCLKAVSKKHLSFIVYLTFAQKIFAFIALLVHVRNVHVRFKCTPHFYSSGPFLECCYSMPSRW